MLPRRQAGMSVNLASGMFGEEAWVPIHSGEGSGKTGERSACIALSYLPRP